MQPSDRGDGRSLGRKKRRGGSRKQGSGVRRLGKATKKYTIEVRGYSHGTIKRHHLATDQTGREMGDDQKSPTEYKPTKRTDGPVALSWDREPGLEDRDIPSTPLFIHEKIHPVGFIESLRGRLPQQIKLFGEYDGINKDSIYKFYKHGANWQNRIIRGESSHVMASLLGREEMNNKIDMVYFDPPYGMDFSAIMQPNARKTSESKGIPPDTVSMKAFRDTYKNGMHSYFDNIYRIAVLSRDLLADSGSFFIQIGNDNVNRVGVILDEVFGPENRISMIGFRKTGGSSTKHLPGGTDYILWYAKNKENVKYRQLYEPFSDRKEWLDTCGGYEGLELKDGSTRRLMKSELENLDLIPDGSRLFDHELLFSQHHNETRSFPYCSISFHRQFDCMKNSHWRVSYKGLDVLDQKKRLAVLGKKNLMWKWYESEHPGKKINNMWSSAMRPNDIHYVVETAESVIERCILLSTDPGDLVYDPTCGSGTTAYVAEKWARRWITSDSGAIAVTFARQRLATGIFPYYYLLSSEDGFTIENRLRIKSNEEIIERPVKFSNDPSDGLILARTPKLTAATLAYNQPPEVIMHPNRPEIDKSLLRVSSPFTIETLSPYRYEKPEALLEHATIDPTYAVVKTSVVEALETPGITMDGVSTPVSNIEENLDGRCITHIGEINGERAAILITPPDCTIPYEMVNRAAKQADEMSGITKLIVVGFAWEGSAYTKAEEKKGQLEIYRVHASMELQIENLKNTFDDSTLVMIGEPRVMIVSNPNDPTMISISIDGFDTYDPASGNLRPGKPEEVICWILDTDYDGKSFFAKRIHFPDGNSDKQVSRFYKKLEKIIDPEEWNHVVSTKSSWFKIPKNKKIAIRIITETHMEMTSIYDIDDHIQI